MENVDRKEILDSLDHLEMMEEWEELVPQAHQDLLEPWWKERRFLALLVLLALMGHLVCLVILVLRERWEQEEIKDSVGLLGKMVCVVLLGYKAGRAGQGILVLWVHKEKKETWEMLGRWDHLEFRGLQA